MANQYKAYDDKELLAAYEQYGSKSAAADALGCHRNTVADAIKRADQAMYLAKRAGKNRVLGA